MPTLHSFNEWSRLRSIVVGRAQGAAWPGHDPVFCEHVIDQPFGDYRIQSGAVPTWLTEEADQELEAMCDTLRDFGVEVHRPQDNDFVHSQGMYNYCPRDRVLVAGNIAIDVCMMFPCRDQEINYLRHVLPEQAVIHMPRDQGMIMDAANVCRLGDDWLYLLSRSGNQAALDWLRQTLPGVRIHACDFYQGIHIDSTIVPVREGLVVINSERVSPDTVPECLQHWDKIWIDRCTPQSFYKYPYSSAWIGLNMLSIDADHVMVDAQQHELCRQLESHGVTPVPMSLRHSRTLGGGFHCVTLDLWRSDD